MPDNNNASKNAPLINFPALLTAYKHNWLWIVASVIICAALGAIALLKKQSSCEVVAQVLISDEGSKSFSAMSDIAGMFGGGGSFGSNRSIDDEMVILMAHSVLKETVEDLGINVGYTVKKNILKKEHVYTKTPVLLQYDTNIADTLGINLKFELEINEKGVADITVKGRKNKTIATFANQSLPASINIPYGSFMFSPTEYYKRGKSLKETITLSSYDGAALALSSMLTVDFSKKKTDIMLISYVTSDPDFGKLLVNTLIENYNNLTVRQKQDFNKKSLEFLTERIRKISAEVDTTERNVESFMGRRDLVNPEEQALILIEQITEQEVELIKSENEYELLMKAIDFLTDEANKTSMLPIMPSTESLTGLIEGYNALILERLNVQASAKANNVALKALNDRIDIVKSNLLTALNKQKETSEFGITELRKQYSRSKSKLKTVPGIEREYVNIMRQQTIKEQLYTYLLRQYEETELAIAGAHPRGVIIDEAYISNPQIGLSGKFIVIIFTILGLIIPAGFIILKWNISKTVELNEQAETLTGFPTIVDIKLTDATEPIIVTEPNSQAAAQYRLLRSNFLSTLGGEKSTEVVTIAGTTGSECAARTAINFAASLAATGRKILLLDFDYINAPVAGLLKLKSENNLAVISSGNEPAIAPIPLHGGEALSVVTGTPGNYSGADAVASLNLLKYLSSTSGKYDFVIINAPQGKENVASVESLSGMSTALMVTYTLNMTLKKTLSRYPMMCHDGKPAGYLISIS